VENNATKNEARISFGKSLSTSLKADFIPKGFLSCLIARSIFLSIASNSIINVHHLILYYKIMEYFVNILNLKAAFAACLKFRFFNLFRN